MTAIDIILQLIYSKYDSDVAFEVAFGLKPKTINDWKRDKSKSYLKMLPQLAEHFNVSIDYLLGKSNIKEKSPNDITFDDFTYAMHNESKELSDEDKEMLLYLARKMKKRLDEKKGK